MKTLKIFLLVLMVSTMTLISSCFVPGPGHGSHGGGYERHGNNGHHNNYDHHDNDDHHDN